MDTLFAYVVGEDVDFNDYCTKAVYLDKGLAEAHVGKTTEVWRQNFLGIQELRVGNFRVEQVKVG